MLGKLLSIASTEGVCSTALRVCHLYRNAFPFLFLGCGSNTKVDLPAVCTKRVSQEERDFGLLRNMKFRQDFPLT